MMIYIYIYVSFSFRAVAFGICSQSFPALHNSPCEHHIGRFQVAMQHSIGMNLDWMGAFFSRSKDGSSTSGVEQRPSKMVF